MPRIDRDFAGKERISQTEIYRATARDCYCQGDPPKQPSENDMTWDTNEPESGPLSVKLGDIFQQRPR